MPWALPVTPALPPDVVRRYLRLLGLDGPPAGPDGLADLVRRHLCRVPFENVSKLRLFGREGTGRPTGPAEFLDGIEHHDLGGTCYTSNPFLAELLSACGYDADLLGADMSEPNVHTVVRVRLAGRDWHVDVGYAAPFYGPIALDDLPHTVAFGGLEYEVARQEGRLAVRVTRDGARQHGYTVTETPRRPEFFRNIVLQSFEPGRTFMTVLRITKFYDRHAVELRNRTLLRLDARTVRRRELSGPADLRDAVANEFQMPRCPVEEAIAALERLAGRSFWGSAWPDRT